MTWKTQFTTCPAHVLFAGSPWAFAIKYLIAPLRFSLLLLSCSGLFFSLHPREAPPRRVSRHSGLILVLGCLWRFDRCPSRRQCLSGRRQTSPPLYGGLGPLRPCLRSGHYVAPSYSTRAPRRSMVWSHSWNCLTRGVTRPSGQGG